MNKARYLFIADFDGTLYDTSKPSPSGMTVERAYVRSLDDLFGEGTGEHFFSINGFHGESPSQIIQRVLEINDRQVVDNAKEIHSEHDGNFPKIIPESQDGKLPWNAEEPQVTLTSMLVIRKLGYLLQEIGTLDKDGNPWPLPFEGVVDFFRSLGSLRKNDVPIDFAIVSSGHEEFIKKALEVWRMPQPDILVTEDNLRLRKFPQEAEIKFKPGVFSIALAHSQWLKSQGLSFSEEIGRNTRTRIMHIGDNPTKDLVMADRAGVRPNLLFPATSWTSITKTLITNRDLFDGRPFADILEPQLFEVEGGGGRYLERR
ncbi:MAG: hypothetical protein HYT07_00130 [Candidatus Levybacteria bacterium]|nr:hypothetical protein [Candidatus Levybacteria bacterium]